jgi:hypothetical protein
MKLKVHRHEWRKWTENYENLEGISLQDLRFTYSEKTRKWRVCLVCGEVQREYLVRDESKIGSRLEKAWMKEKHGFEHLIFGDVI